MPTTIRTQYRHSGVGHNRMHDSPQGRMSTAVRQDHADCALTNLGGKACSNCPRPHVLLQPPRNPVRFTLGPRSSASASAG